MTHTEVFDELLKAHRTNYRKLSVERGMVPHYYFKAFNTVGKGMAAGAFIDYIGIFGAELWAVGPCGEKNLSELRDDVLPSQKGGASALLETVVKLCGILGYSLVVRDGASEYVVTSGEVNEATKIRNRKRGAAARVHDEVHGTGAV